MAETCSGLKPAHFSNTGRIISYIVCLTVPALGRSNSWNLQAEYSHIHLTYVCHANQPEEDAKAEDDYVTTKKVHRLQPRRQEKFDMIG